jgi:hypothetical protein
VRAAPRKLLIDQNFPSIQVFLAVAMVLSGFDNKPVSEYNPLPVALQHS